MMGEEIGIFVWIAPLLKTILDDLSKLNDGLRRLSDHPDQVEDNLYCTRASLQVCQQKFEVLNREWGSYVSHGYTLPSDQALWDENMSTKIRSSLETIVTILEDLEKKIAHIPKRPRHRYQKYFACIIYWHRKGRPQEEHQKAECPVRILAEDLCEYVDAVWACYQATNEAYELRTSTKALVADEIRNDRSTRRENMASGRIFDIFRASTEECAIDLTVISYESGLERPQAEPKAPVLSYHIWLGELDTSEKFKEIHLKQSLHSQGTVLFKIWPKSEEKDLAADMGFVNLNLRNPTAFQEMDIPLSDRLRKLLKSFNGQTFEIYDPTMDGQIYIKTVKELRPVVPVPEIASLLALFEPRPMAESKTMSDRMPLVERIDLAFRIVAYGSVTLGTPWASYLYLSNIRRIWRAEEPLYFLDFSKRSTTDLEEDHASNIDETSQLLNIGILLTEVGLQQSKSSLGIDNAGSWSERVKALPRLERAMGSQYCKATAFCLQRRRPAAAYEGSDDIKQSKSEAQRKHFYTLLEEYQKNVFDRLHDLRSLVKTAIK